MRLRLQKLLILAFTFTFMNLSSQDDLSSLVDNEVNASEEKEYVSATFKTTRLINLSTNEQVKRGELDFRIAHRFGDLATKESLSNFFGFDNVADIRFSFDYGVTDKWAIGIGRTKGAYATRQIWDVNTKYKIFQQETEGFPVGISFNGIASFTSMESTNSPTDVTYFDNSFAHRWSYFGQFLFVRKFSQDFSLILSPSVLHRNLVKAGDNNTHIAMAAGLRMKISKRAAIIADYYQVLNQSDYQKSIGFQMPVGLGFEIETGGHVFHALLSSNRGLLENQFLAENSEEIGLGEIRLGFNISRVFNIIK